MRKMRKFCGAVLALMLLSACGAGEEKAVSQEIYAMDTVMQVSAYGQQGGAAVKELETAIREMESELSRTDGKSPVARLNAQPETPVPMTEEVLDLLETAEGYSRLTGGAFDPTIASVADAWGFTEKMQQVPTAEALRESLEKVGIERVHVDRDAGTVWAEEGTKLDLGGIAKGWASDRAAEIYAAHEVPRGLVDLGGNVLAWGQRPDGAPWRVGVRDPQSEGIAGVLSIEDSFAITSGGYQRYFEQGGRRYHHIIDPSTGYPAESGLLSVTVVAPVEEGRGTLCDALSTALFVLGEERALDLWRQRQEEFQLILLTEDGRAVVTDGLAEAFALEEESGYAQEIVS